MNLAVDLHIHSALSPCAENDMTPANIVHMAALKGLDAIAVTDHNACFNLEAVSHFAYQAGLLFLPGIEVTTAEEVHILVYFEDLQKCLDFGEIIYESLPDTENIETFFGKQLKFDNHDKVCGKASKWLSQATPFSIGSLKRKAEECGGLFIPAHINREAYSILNNLGFIPENLKINAVEIRREFRIPEGLNNKYKIVSSSDAHSLGRILERAEFLDVKEKNIHSLLDALR